MNEMHLNSGIHTFTTDYLLILHKMIDFLSETMI